MPTQQDLNDALRSAAFEGKKEFIELLLDKGAEIEGKDSIGNTALTVAMVKGNLDFAATLLENGADIDAKDFNHWTPLMRVAHTGSSEAVRFLLEKGADISWKDLNNETAATLARDASYPEVAELIESWTGTAPREPEKTPKDSATSEAENLSRQRLEQLKSRRPKQSPFGRP